VTNLKGIDKEMQRQLTTPGVGVDFHMHTLASDGLWSPESLVETAAVQGVRILAVSDHDTIKNVGPVQAQAARRGLGFVPGVEVTINWKNNMYHMLVFNFDPHDTALNALLDDTEAQQTAKKQDIIEGLRKRGYNLHRLNDLKRPDGSFLAVDIARALYRGGEVATFDQALHECRKEGLERICSQPADVALKVGLAAGGIPVLAHPGRYEYGFTVATTEILREMVDMGLAGVEVYHYSHQPADVARYLEFARQNELIISAGSDSHNESRKPTPWNPELTRTLLERLNMSVPNSSAA
jgi:3',5'-nucleoside bisphosphate phosphatase